jgi:hypothetical protein
MVNKERVGALIQKLQEQFDQNAPAHYLLITAHQLQASLLEQSFDVNQANNQIEINVKKAEPVVQKIPEAPLTPSVLVENNVPKINFELKEPEQVNQPIKIETGQTPIIEAKITPEIKQQNNKELNDHLATKDKSLNEALHTKTPEIGEVIDETPIANLCKAFSINEKFLITQMLFRNDDLAYERSLKTLNNFSNHSEALLWMEREFIVNLSWDKNNEMVQEFYNVVKRRFL